MAAPRQAAPDQDSMKRYARMFAVQLAAALKQSATQTASLSMNEEVGTLLLSAMYPKRGGFARSLTCAQRSEFGGHACHGC